MITFTIKPVDNELADRSELLKIYQALTIEFREKKFLSPYQQGYSVRVNNTSITIFYGGLCSDMQQAHQFLKYLANELAAILSDMGLQGLYYVSENDVSFINGDMMISVDAFKPSDTKNAILVENYVKDSDIPEEYLCNMTQQLMDEPVFTVGRPDIKYNGPHLKFWLRTQDVSRDPITNIRINPVDDIKDDDELKKKISSYVHDTVKAGLKAKREKFLEVMAKYKLEVKEPNIDKAFRRAAAENNIDDMNVLEGKITHINAQDDNPINKRTALHWAILRESEEAVKYLLKRNARTDIKDANGKTSLDYAKIAKNEVIRCLILDEEDEPVYTSRLNI